MPRSSGASQVHRGDYPSTTAWHDPVGGGVMPEARWYPVVTFWQLTADMAGAARVPPGHAHEYESLFADAWLRSLLRGAGHRAIRTPARGPDARRDGP
ncbi:MAG: alpha/beta-hydrolase family protein [Actinomycetota bacterium]|nr:alpha/beta-hydrolase family protein [Actinomycetota bacterium]